MVSVHVLLFPALIDWNYSCAMRPEKDPYNVFWNYHIRVLTGGIVIRQIEKHVWRLVFCLQLLWQYASPIWLSVITPMWNFRQEEQTWVLFQCQSSCSAFSVQVWQVTELRNAEPLDSQEKLWPFFFISCCFKLREQTFVHLCTTDSSSLCLTNQDYGMLLS